MEHYFTKDPQTKFRVYRIKGNILDNELEFFTSNSVFSKTTFDEGSKLMVETFFSNEFVDNTNTKTDNNSNKLKSNNKIDNSNSKTYNLLDLGCAYGFVGISLKKNIQNINVDMIDINTRAVFVAKRNVILNNIKEGTNVFSSDGFEKIEKKYDFILFNPPQSAGNLICNNLINNSHEFLEKGGKFYVVSRHNKGGKSFKDLMKKVYNNVDTIEKKGKYAIYISEKE